MANKSGLLVLASTVLLIFISIYSSFPPPVKTTNLSEIDFSVKKAYSHLLEISKTPHSTGTTENKRVRNYIVSTCQQLGISVSIQHVTSIQKNNTTVNAANIYNVIAHKKGLKHSKAVLVMAHYDSHLNTSGAGDDGVGVAAMLETVRALKYLKPLKNDIIFLFTDGEELGMLGASAFVKESTLINDVGIVINFEGRGNSGSSNMFEVNANNGWIIKEYAKSVAHPFGNSIGYELYKKMPNFTDFALFKNIGIAGLNNAYIGGYANYHSPNDTPENMDLASFQNHGENMLSLVKHFGNLNIISTKEADVTYFNVIGKWFVHYPASWNFIMVIFINFLFIAYTIVGIRSGTINFKHFVLSIFILPLTVAITYFSAKILLKIIISNYPLYAHFIENNSYNSEWYFLAIFSMAVTIFTGVYCMVHKKILINSLLAGVFLILIFIMNLMQYFIPSASYLLIFPLFIVLTIRIWMITKYEINDLNFTQISYLNFISIIPAILLIAPVIYYSFLAFSLGSLMPYVTIAAVLFLGLLLPVLNNFKNKHQLFIPITAFACFGGAMLIGHFTSGYSKNQPLLSSLHYLLETDSSKAKWIADFSVDKWSGKFLKKKSENLSLIKFDLNQLNTAPVVPLASPAAIVIKDSLHNGKRFLKVHFTASRENAVFFKILIDENSLVNQIAINGKIAKSDQLKNVTSYKKINFTGASKEGFDVDFVMDHVTTLNLITSDFSIGLPKIADINTAYPNDILPAQNGYSNLTEVVKHYHL